MTPLAPAALRLRMGVVVAVGVAATSLLTFGVADRPAAAAPQATKTLPTFCTEGAASCASTSCHGRGDQGDPPGIKGSEYNLWLSRDAHAAAGRVLTEERSVRMGKILGLAKAPVEAPECLKCHGQFTQPTGAQPKWTAVEGVGCENCHGPAEKYLTDHFRPEFLRMPPESKATYGLRNLTDLETRAKSCVPCHVGAPGQEVNHDLIAAGHPMLRFEFASYLANYQGRHWSLPKDKANRAAFESQAWSIGQRVAADAALVLLADRAQKHSANPSQTPWPEFSEYDCHSCHRGLGGQESWRAKQVAAAGGKPGTYPWGTWYFAPSTGQDLPILSGLKTELAKPYPNPARVIEGARAARGQLTTPRIATSVADCRSRILSLADATQAAGDNWERGRQRYLAIVAQYEAARDLAYASKAAPSWIGNATLTAALKQADAASLDWKTFDPARFATQLRSVHDALVANP